MNDLIEQILINFGDIISDQQFDYMILFLSDFLSYNWLEVQVQTETQCQRFKLIEGY